MDLSISRLLFLDCQTTGMRPTAGSLLELGWGFGRASEPELEILESDLVQLPEGKNIPLSVQELTGIQPADLQGAIPLEKLFIKFQESLQKNNETGLAVIHYAQFEKSFLEDLYFKMTGEKNLPFRLLCSQKLAHRLFPQLPSRNIRGLAGHFGEGTGELKRAGSHVKATFQIWRKITEQLNQQGIFTFEQLEAWLSTTPSIPKVSYQYQIDRDKRLKLPKKPGVYFMKSKTGQILYVGKATSLRDRVNSYFRGRKGRDPKKLEMLTQVWDLDFIETGSALEAALLETDEIKKWNPAYNISLKTGSRGLIFYSRNFEQVGFRQDDVTMKGPFRPNGSIEQLRLLQKSLLEKTFYPIFYEPYPVELMQAGFDLLCLRHDMDSIRLTSIRSQLCLGLKLLREHLKSLALSAKFSEETANMETLDFDAADSETAAGAEDEEETAVTAEDIADKFERLFLRAAQDLRKSKMLTLLLNCHLEWESEVGWRSLDIRQGRFQAQAATEPITHPWQNMTIADYDRMSIVFSEVSRKPHVIRKLATLPGCSDSNAPADHEPRQNPL
jgi:DNA polymerase-3 subunit epsilon